MNRIQIVLLFSITLLVVGGASWVNSSGVFSSAPERDFREAQSARARDVEAARAGERDLVCRAHGSKFSGFVFVHGGDVRITDSDNANVLVKGTTGYWWQGDGSVSIEPVFATRTSTSTPEGEIIERLFDSGAITRRDVFEFLKTGNVSCFLVPVEEDLFQVPVSAV